MLSATAKRTKSGYLYCPCLCIAGRLESSQNSKIYFVLPLPPLNNPRVRAEHSGWWIAAHLGRFEPQIAIRVSYGESLFFCACLYALICFPLSGTILSSLITFLRNLLQLRDRYQNDGEIVIFATSYTPVRFL